MGVHDRVSKAIMNAAQQHSTDIDDGAHGTAHAAIATMFNWLSDPSETMLEVGKDNSHDKDERRCRRVWSAMLIQAQIEAGFVVPVTGSPNPEDPEAGDPEHDAAEAADQYNPEQAAPAADPLWTRFLSKLR